MNLSEGKPTILVGVEDPGAANALAPVAVRLIHEGRLHVMSLCRTLAAPIFESFGIPFEKVGADARLAEQTVAVHLTSIKPQLVFIGTSENNLSIDRLCLMRAKSLGIPTVGLVDYWTRYVQRFSGPTPNERLHYMPDIIFVIDKAAHDAMVAEGFPEQRLVITGHPYLDGYAERLTPLSGEACARFRASLGVEADQRLVTFVSETLDDWKANEAYRFPQLSTSKERTIVILEHVIAALTELVEKAGLRIVLVNKLHPKNRFEEFEWLDKVHPPFPIRSIQNVNNLSLLQISSLVIGMTSMLVVEAACLGIPTLSVVPLPHEELYGPNGELSWHVARSPQELREAITTLIKTDELSHCREVAARIHAQHKGATQRIVGHLYQRIGLSQCKSSRTKVKKSLSFS